MAKEDKEADMAMTAKDKGKTEVKVAPSAEKVHAPKGPTTGELLTVIKGIVGTMSPEQQDAMKELFPILR